MKLVTVATHNSGMYDDLINNRFNAKITTLAFGKKWTGFQMKYEEMYNYIKNMNDDEIVVFIDGFDSKINKNPKLAVNLFRKMKCGILFSEDNAIRFKKKNKNMFGQCQGTTINSGLYMGYVKYLKIIFHDLIKLKCRDDQRNINKTCHKYNFIQIDRKKIIFENIKNKEKKSNAIFISYPGELSIKRLLRAPYEYSQFWVKEAFIMYLVLTFIFLCLKMYKTTTGIFFFFFVLYLYKDSSCKSTNDHIHDLQHLIQKI